MDRTALLKMEISRMIKLLCEGRSVGLVPAGTTGASAGPHPSRVPFGWAEKRTRPERDNVEASRDERAWVRSEKELFRNEHFREGAMQFH